MKRSLLCYSLICTLLLAACTAETPPLESAPLTSEPGLSELPVSEPPQPVFFLEALPELAPFTAPREIISRYGEAEFVDTLQAAADYGKLYPYKGDWRDSSFRYGLVDAQGRIVVDPVYSYAEYVMPPHGEEPAYLLLAYPVDKDDEEAQRLLEVLCGSLERRRFVFASADGAWVSDTFYGDWAALSEDRIVITEYIIDHDNLDPFWRNPSYCIYDFKGRLLGKGNGSLYGFQEGLSVVCHNKSDAKIGQPQEYYNYIDKNGRVVIAGPFLEAQGFVDGRANVTLGDDWYRNPYAVIDSQGNFIGEPSREAPPLLYGGESEAIIFGDNISGYGLRDREGNISIAAQYKQIYSSYEPGTTLALGERKDGSFWRINLNNSQESALDFTDLNIYDNNVDIFANNWCIVRFEKPGEYGLFRRGAALLNEEAEYRFEAQDANIYCEYMYDGLFAINYQNDVKDHYVLWAEIFDADRGEVIKTVEGHNFQYMVYDAMLLFYGPDVSRKLVLNRDFEPAISPADLGGGFVKEIQHVADDVYSVRTTFYSGLFSEKRGWLIRVYANSQD